jgi:hypothetical protein
MHKMARAATKDGAIFITPPVLLIADAILITLMLKTDWRQPKTRLLAAHRGARQINAARFPANIPKPIARSLETFMELSFLDPAPLSARA